MGGGRFAALAVGFDLESELLALSQAVHFRTFDGGDVNKHVGAAVSCCECRDLAP
jgi:hypothetical protein